MPRSFEEVVLPHLDAAFNYARWLTKNDGDAEDVVQDASVRALRFFSSWRGEDAPSVRRTHGRFADHAPHDGRHSCRELGFGMIAMFRTPEDDRRRNKLLVAAVS